jgi:hypothetical protein
MDIHDSRIRDAEERNKLESKTLKNRYRGETHRLRTDYAGTIQRIEKVFDKSNIFYGFYEAMFNNDLGFSFIDPNFNTRINQSDKTIEIDEQLQRQIVQFYKHT